MNKAAFEERWPLIRERVGSRWSLMTGTELVKVDKAEVKFDKCLTLLQVKYGYTRQQAKEEIVKLWAEHQGAKASDA